MSETEQKTTTQDSALSDDLAQFSNDFAEFNESYAFFCDALAGLVANFETRDPNTIQGMNRGCRWMKNRMEEFRVRLEAIQENLSR